jgi:hypothetical protein
MGFSTEDRTPADPTSLLGRPVRNFSLTESAEAAPAASGERGGRGGGDGGNGGGGLKGGLGGNNLT